MIHLFNRTSVAVVASALFGMIAAGSAQAQVVIKDDLTSGHSLYNWKALNGACLTAGDNTPTPHDSTLPSDYTPANDSSGNAVAIPIPACIDPKNGNLAYYKNKTLVGGDQGVMPDVAGKGALRLTNGDWKQNNDNGDQQTGAIISNFTYPSNKGINLTWTTVTYGGDGLSGHGADGMSFFLVDGAKNPSVAGASGGSLGYSCSNTNPVYDGLVGGYLGIGVDEYGNFTNGGTSTDSKGKVTYKDNTATGPGAAAGTIGVRGMGDVAYAELYAQRSDLYTAPTSPLSTAQVNALYATCAYGKYYDMNHNTVTTTSVADYKYLASASLSGIASQQPSSTASDSNPNQPQRSLATLISYTLKITSTGHATFQYSVNGGASATPIPDLDLVANNGALPTTLRFRFSAGTGSGSNIHEITCFKAAPVDTSDTSASSNVQQAAKLAAGSQVFISYFHPTNWWGSMLAADLSYQASSDSIIASGGATWDASCVLTGGSCTTMNSASPPTVTAQASRVILTNDGNVSTSGGVTVGGAGIAFEASTLTAAQLTSLQDSTTSAPEIAYLRGDRSKEADKTNGVYRIRTSLLGDIVDSSPVWVGYPSSSYAGPWADKLGNASNATMAEGTTYGAFATLYATRRNMLYVGANDGMLHGFSAGSYTAPSGTTDRSFVTTLNTGAEMMAYVPAQVISVIHPVIPALDTVHAGVDYSNPSYVHNFFVDATPGSGDLYYGATPAWHTWLAGGLGVGGHADGAIQDNTATVTAPAGAFYVLDVTNPGGIGTGPILGAPGNFSEATASSVVVGEWNSSNLTCPSSLAPKTNCGIYLGQVLGTPVIRRLHDGSWGVIFGNGTNAPGGSGVTSGHSGLFIMHVAANGDKTFQYIDAGSTAAGGIVQVAAADLDGDHITDFVYAGDVLGNLYRFDLTDNSASNWSAMKIFTASSWQPITSAPVVTAIPGAGTGSPKVLVVFGTGQKLPLTATAAEKYSAATATKPQSLYGIWDANMYNWNRSNTDTKYANLQTAATPAISVTALQSQTVTNATTASATVPRTVSNTTMCWQGMSGCTGTGITANAMGWELDLPTASEQVIFNPLVANGDLFVNTTIPATSNLFSCTSTTAAGWTMGISLTNGGSGAVPAFDGGVSGYSLNGAGTPAVYSYNTSSYLGTNTNDQHQFKSKKLAPQPGVGKRVTWTKIR